MSIAHALPRPGSRLSALAAARLARAQPVLCRRCSCDDHSRAGTVLLGSQRIRARRTSGGDIAPGGCRDFAQANHANHAAIEDTQAKFHSARQYVHEVLRQEPFDVEAMRAATAQTRAARLNFDQTVQGIFADIAAKITPAGRQALANWPPGRRKTVERQTVVILLLNRVALWPGFESALDALGWEDKGGGNDSLGAPVLDNAAEYMRITAARRLPARRRQAGAWAQYSRRL